DIQKEIDDPAGEHDSSHLRNIKVKLTITAAEDHVAEISLTYLVKRASWKPLFDLRAATDADGMPSNKLALLYRASVQQSTGEDWLDATLNLSTASPDSIGTKIPKLNGVKIIQKAYSLFSTTKQQGGGLNANALFGQRQTNVVPHRSRLPPQTHQPQIQQYAPQQQQAVTWNDVTQLASLAHGTEGVTHGGFGWAGPDSADAQVDGDEEEEEEEAELPLIAVPDAVASKNNMAANFQVQGKANIRSDGSTHKVAIATLSLKAKIEQVAVPRSMNGTYLHCTLNNSSDTHLLPGNLNIYLDDGYIANTSISHVAPGDTFRCSLGRDYSVAMNYNQKNEKVILPSTMFGASQEKMLYTVNCSIYNKKDREIKGLVVRDVIPVAENPSIKVVLVKPAGLAEAEEGKDVSVEKGVDIRWCKAVGDKGGMKEGRIEWKVDLGPRETKTLTLQWEVVTPFGVRWTFEDEKARKG
ncbi:hypothetical protein FRC17_002822, partial [Serendipita sp. 399]